MEQETHVNKGQKLKALHNNYKTSTHSLPQWDHLSVSINGKLVSGQMVICNYWVAKIKKTHWIQEKLGWNSDSVIH